MRRTDSAEEARSNEAQHCVLAALAVEYEFDRPRRDLPQLRFIAERAFEHGKASRHGDDMECGGLGVSLELAARDAVGQRVPDQTRDAPQEMSGSAKAAFALSSSPSPSAEPTPISRA